MKAPRDYRKWTAEEVQSDTRAYVEAQQATRELEARERAQAKEKYRYERFEAAFIAGRGSKAGARAEYDAIRNADAAEAACRKDEDALRSTSSATRGDSSKARSPS